MFTHIKYEYATIAIKNPFDFEYTFDGVTQQRP